MRVRHLVREEALHLHRAALHEPLGHHVAVLALHRVRVLVHGDLGHGFGGVDISV